MTQFVRLSPARKLNLIVIYPGVGYGVQDFVLGRMSEKVLPGMGEQKVLIAVAPASNTPWFDVVREIHSYAEAEGLHLTPGALIGWSGGAKGIADAVAAGHDFPSVMLADPSPVEQAFYGPNTRVWYNPSNWKGSLAHLGPRQVEYAQPLGASAFQVTLDHNQILDEVIKAAIKEQKMSLSPLLLIGVPVVLVALIVGYRMMKNSISVRSNRALPDRYGTSPQRKAELSAQRKRYRSGTEKYKLLPTDVKARKAGKVKPSAYTVAAKRRGLTLKGQDFEDLARRALRYYDAQGNTKQIAGALEESYDKGLAAWASGGHRPGASSHNWANARLSSLLVGGKTYWSADSKQAKTFPVKMHNEIEDQIDEVTDELAKQRRYKDVAYIEGKVHEV